MFLHLSFSTLILFVGSFDL